MNSKDIQKLLGYKQDKDGYKQFNDYSLYHNYCLDNKLIVALERDEFKDILKHRDGQSQKFQKFADLMYTPGYNLGMAQKELCMSFDEVSIAMDGMIKKDCHAYFSKTYNPNGAA